MRAKRSYREPRTKDGKSILGSCVIAITAAWAVLFVLVLLWSSAETWIPELASIPDAAVTVCFPSAAVLLGAAFGSRRVRRGGILVGIVSAGIVWSMLVGIAYVCGAVVLEKYLLIQGGGCLLAGLIGGGLARMTAK